MARETKCRIEDIGLSAVTMAAERTSNFIDCVDAAHLEIRLNTTRDAHTAVHVDIDWYATDQGSPTAFKELGVSSVASSGGYCVATLEPARWTRTSSTHIVGSFIVPCRDRFCKIRVNSTAGGASDVFTLGVALIKP
jgi:hypothetical protein